MSQTQESQCTQLIHFDGSQLTQKELKEALEKGNTDSKIEHMKTLIMMHLNGEPQNSMLMTYIRFVLPKEDHTLKKLGLYFLEIIDKTDASGKLLPEMILVCNFIRNDLQHANEYVRGVTLRFISKVREQELIEPLTDAIMSNLDHRNAYVRRNAIMALMSVYQRFPQFFPDAAELVEGFLENESDVTSKRNAFLMLFNCAQERAVRFLRKAIACDIESSGEVFQLAVVDLLKHLCKTSPSEKAQYLGVIFGLLSSKHPAVLFQCATTLQSLSTSPTAIREAASTFVKLLTAHADNNVKLIVIDRLEAIKKRSPKILSDLLIDLLRTLQSPVHDLRRRILELSIDLTNEKNVEKAVQFLKKEVLKTQEEASTMDKQSSNEYCQLLVRTIHQCTIKHPQVAGTIVPVLSDYLVDSGPSAVDVMLFIREIITKQPHLRDEVLAKLTDMFGSISSTRVLRIMLWVLGSHSKSADQVSKVITTIQEAIGPFPLMPAEKVSATETSKGEKADVAGADSAVTTNTTVSKDGTYLTTIESGGAAPAEDGSLPFRNLLVTGDFFLATALCNNLVKLVLHSIDDDRQHVKTKLKMEVMEIINEVLSLGTRCKPPIDDDSHERIALCLALLQNSNGPLAKGVLDRSSTAFRELVKDSGAPAAPSEIKTQVPVDAGLKFTQLSKDAGNKLAEEMEVEDVGATGGKAKQGQKSEFLARLDRVMQLTGLSDTVYCEATVMVNQFDISVDMLVVNQSQHTLQNLTVELATVGDLKLCERPQNYTVAPKEQIHIKVNIKVSSTETGIIFGNIVYDGTGSSCERMCVILNDIHIDIMDYISPSNCSPTAFRSMWAEFEWENKVAVNTEIKSLREYLDHILKNTNMKSLTSDNFIQGECDFLSANLYAKSSFGEDALANISIERQMDGKIEGFVRIRAKTQGIALSLGDKITMKQKG